MWRIKTAAILCALSILLSGCGQKAVEPDTPAYPDLALTIDEAFPDVLGLELSESEFPRLDGSTSTIPLGEALAAIIMGKDREECKKYAGFSGTNESYKNLVDGKTDILVVYEMPDEAKEYVNEKSCELEIAPIGRDGLVFIVNVQNPVNNLTTQQIVDIYTGKITDWQEVGGEDAPIAAYQRNETSGSQTLMKKLVMREMPLMIPRENHIAWGMFEIINSIADYDNGQFAIGYNMYYYVEEMEKDPNIKILSVDGVFPGNDTIASGKYPFVNNFYVVIRQDAPEESPERLLYRWLQSIEGQMLIASQGYVTLRKLQR
ncbi:MAG: substrate-binding domain-containing protein [Firmicutes bacterium]|nr:substrate-binding domain-containing protein [Bacillota bacterium]